MLGFKLFEESLLKKEGKIEEIISNWLNEQPIKIIKMNQSNDTNGYLLISILYLI